MDIFFKYVGSLRILCCEMLFTEQIIRIYLREEINYDCLYK